MRTNLYRQNHFIYLCNIKPFPISEFCRGWWRLTDPNDIVEIEKSLSIRGTREQILAHNLRRGMDFCKHPDKKSLGEELALEMTEEMLEVPDLLECGAPPVDQPGQWSSEAALRVDKYVLEQVEALEDKVAAASMQVPVRVEPIRVSLGELSKSKDFNDNF